MSTPAINPSTIVGIQFRTAGKIFPYDAADFELAPGDFVVVELDRGVASGEVILGAGKVPAPLIPKEGSLYRVLRKATDEDFHADHRNQSRAIYALQAARKKGKTLGLPMKFVQVEYLLDGSKAIFYYTSEERVDFRQLVRELARELHTRIEMRQIGIRDEAKLIGGIGICGRELCCTTFLREFFPISIRMAKDQNLELNPLKRAGRCGRLRCCLAYEHSTYIELGKLLPRVGSRVETPNGPAFVKHVNCLRQTLYVVLEDGSETEIEAAKLNRPAETPSKAPTPTDDEAMEGEAAKFFLTRSKSHEELVPVQEETLASLEDDPSSNS